MKKIIMIITLALSLMLVNGTVKAENSAQLDGDWLGTIYLEGGRKFDVRLVVAGNTVQQFYKDKDLVWKQLNLPQSQFVSNGGNGVFSWINTRGNLAETHIFSLTIKQQDKMEIAYTRQNTVTNFAGESDTVVINGLGTLWRIN